MRTYARTPDLVWQEVDDSNPDAFWLANLAQTLKLYQGENPFYPSSGVAVYNIIYRNMFADKSLIDIANAFSPYFASLQISRGSAVDANTVRYSVFVVLKNGTNVSYTVDHIAL